ncbi:MAG: O-antigen ligase family protein [Pyrinomonadaceae bacterium]
MSQATTEIEAIAPGDRSAVKLRVASILGRSVFLALLCLIVWTAIPYGTSQPWAKAAFICVVFTLAILWLIEGSISQTWLGDSWPLVFPLAALALSSFLQTLSRAVHGSNPGGIGLAPWNAISADPYQTRFFALLLLALTVSGVLLARYVSSEKRLRIVINLVIGVAVASAVFGILRQTTQHDVGFGLPLLELDSGYGQFINKNHFAYLMEMTLGLILGLILAGGVKREQALIYLAALLPVWIGLVLCNSRGGLIAMLAQIIIAALLFSKVARKGTSRGPQSKVIRITQSLPVRAILILVLIVGVVFGTVWLGGDRLATRIEDRTELKGDPEGLRYGVSRNEIWKATWRMFVAHPVLGVGMGGYWAAIPAFHDASGAMTPQEAHNDYLELLASGGLVGLALGLWFAIIVFKRMRENLRSPNRVRRAACFGAAIGIAGVAVHSLVDFGLHTIINALVFTTLIVIATSKPHWGDEPTRLHD